MLSVAADAPPDGENWLQEIKHDGIARSFASPAARERAYTRRRLDWSTEYRRVVEAASRLRCKAAIMQFADAVPLAQAADFMCRTKRELREES